MIDKALTNVTRIQILVSIATSIALIVDSIIISKFLGTTAMAGYGTYFYEFLERGEKTGVPVFRSSLVPGREYTMIVTTPSGLYRFNTETVIRIVENGEKTVFTIA